MFRLAHRLLPALLVLVQVANLLLPIRYAYAGGAASVDVNLPIDEIQGLIQQLEDAGAQVVGEAGVEVRASIQELSDEMQQRIDQIRSASKEVIQTAVTELRTLLNQLVLQAKALLAEIRSMISGAIQCISQQLADRIAQLKTSILDILEAVTTAITAVVDHIYQRADQLVDTGTNRVATVLNSTLAVVARIILIVLAFVLLFWTIRILFSGKLPTAPALRFGVPGFVVLILAGIGYLLFSQSALAAILGTKVTLPKWETACAAGTEAYDQFMQLKNQNAPEAELRVAGNKALENLNLCLYASMSPEVGRGTRQKIDEVAAVLYPPPPPPSESHPVAAGCPPAVSGGPVSFNPGWVSRHDLRKVAILAELERRNVLRPHVLPLVRDTSRYFTEVKSVVHVNPSVILATKPALAIMAPVHP